MSVDDEREPAGRVERSFPSCANLVWRLVRRRAAVQWPTTMNVLAAD